MVSTPNDRSRPGQSDPDQPGLDDVMEPEDDALPSRDRSYHGGAKPVDDEELDELAEATEEERVDAGVADYAPSEVPPATDALPEGASPEAERAQRGLDEGGDEA
ncbi:hypothetical protein BKD30_11720 [Tersicoccus phoenicis]|uniref:DUF5709 domain-containing protein n=1 Tax=Tersicoccus phoenicis TaxID=554083 RepID=A0A1R1L7R4_9MICC|nr:hypothetical protein BKD30_11720 [Tersicoccus phoenicis]